MMAMDLLQLINDHMNEYGNTEIIVRDWDSGKKYSPSQLIHNLVDDTTILFIDPQS